MLLSVSLLPADELLRKGRVLERESGVLLPPLPGESRGEAKGADLEESGELGLLLLHLLPNNLRKVGEAMSGYLDPGCLSPDWLDVGLDLGDVLSAAPSCSDTETFSLSV